MCSRFINRQIKIKAVWVNTKNTLITRKIQNVVQNVVKEGQNIRKLTSKSMD